ncbi:hypothetical protein TcCL_NonESM08081, partial [Trypanosoma cruzi]
ADVRHVRVLVVAGLGVAVVVHHIHNALPAVIDFALRALAGVLVHIRRNAVVLAAHLNVAALHDVHNFVLNIHGPVIVADNLGVCQNILEDSHFPSPGSAVCLLVCASVCAFVRARATQLHVEEQEKEYLQK